MNHEMNLTRKLASFCTLLPGTIILALVFVLCSMASDDDVARWLADYRNLALPLYLMAVVISIIVSPFGGPISLMAAGVQVLGFAWAFPAYLVGRALGTTGAYLVGRQYGERLIRTLAGRRGLGLVKRLTRVVNDTTLISLRVFDGNLSDYVSYAAGLQRLPFRSYLWKSNLLPLPFLCCIGFLLHRTRGDLATLTAAIVATTVLSVIATAIVYRFFGLSRQPVDEQPAAVATDGSQKA